MNTTDSGIDARTRRVLLLLSFGTGASDAFAFSLLGGIFTANMTGNLVLAGLPARPGWWPAVLTGAVTATASFLIAAYVGFRITRAGEGARSTRARTLLLFVACGQVVIAVGWFVVSSAEAHGATVLFVAMSSASLGLQTVAAKKIAPSSGITTTFMTGTLVGAVQSVAEGSRSGVRTALSAVGVFVLGACAGGWVAHLAPALSPGVAAAAAVSAAAYGLMTDPSAMEDRGGSPTVR